MPKKSLLVADANEKGDKENMNANEVGHEMIVVSEVRKKSLKDVPNGTAKLIDCGKKYDARKRYSIGNGELRVSGKSREVSPTPRMAQQQKLSADMRLRTGTYSGEDYVARRPVRLKCMSNNLEVYDSLHTKAGNVSTLSPSIRSKGQQISIALKDGFDDSFSAKIRLAPIAFSAIVYALNMHGKHCARRKFPADDH